MIGANYRITDSDSQLEIYFYETDHRLEWWTHLLFLPVRFRGARFHMGWLGYYRKVRDDLRGLCQLASHGGKQIKILGYSQGGAFAVMLAWDLYMDGIVNDVELTTYAAPRAGNRKTRMLNQWANAHRILYWPDIVTMLPPAVFGYRHVGRPARFRGGWNPIANHEAGRP